MPKQQLAIIKEPSFDLVSAVNNITGISLNSRKTYTSCVNSYLKYCDKENLTTGFESVEQWIETSGTAKTQNTRTIAIKQALRQLYKGLPIDQRIQMQDSLERLDNIKLNNVDNTVKKDKFLTKKEVEKLVKNMPERISLFTEFMFMTGLRITPTIEAMHSKTGEYKGIVSITTIGKRKKEHTVPITKDLYKRINKAFKGDKYLFEHHGRAYTRSYISRLIKEHSIRTIKKKISAHSLRHSFAMYQLSRGLDLYKLKSAMAHSSINTTEGSYIHYKPDAKDLGII